MESKLFPIVAVLALLFGGCQPGPSNQLTKTRTPPPPPPRPAPVIQTRVITAEEFELVPTAHGFDIQIQLDPRAVIPPGQRLEIEIPPELVREKLLNNST